MRDLQKLAQALVCIKKATSFCETFTGEKRFIEEALEHLTEANNAIVDCLDVNLGKWHDAE